MKTQLFIGVLVALISSISALQCWSAVFNGKTLDEKTAIKQDCPAGQKCGRATQTEGVVETGLYCTPAGENGCVDKEYKGKSGVVCICDTALCNGADGTSYTHLIIAVIVGAMFFH